MGACRPKVSVLPDVPPGGRAHNGGVRMTRETPMTMTESGSSVRATQAGSSVQATQAGSSTKTRLELIFTDVLDCLLGIIRK